MVLFKMFKMFKSQAFLFDLVRLSTSPLQSSPICICIICISVVISCHFLSFLLIVSWLFLTWVLFPCAFSPKQHVFTGPLGMISFNWVCVWSKASKALRVSSCSKSATWNRMTWITWMTCVCKQKPPFPRVLSRILAGEAAATLETWNMLKCSMMFLWW